MARGRGSGGDITCPSNTLQPESASAFAMVLMLIVNDANSSLCFAHSAGNKWSERSSATIIHNHQSDETFPNWLQPLSPASLPLPPNTLLRCFTTACQRHRSLHLQPRGGRGGVALCFPSLLTVSANHLRGGMSVKVRTSNS